MEAPEGLADRLKAHVFQLIGFWILGVLLCSAILAIPISFLFLPLASVAAVPIVTGLTVCFYCTKMTYGAWLWAARTSGFFRIPVNDQVEGELLTALPTEHSAEDAVPIDPAPLPSPPASESPELEVPAEEPEEKHTGAELTEKSQLRKEHELPIRRESFSEKRTSTSVITPPKVAVRHLRPGDGHFIAICRDLLLAVSDEEDVICPRVGQDEESDHHILSYWRADTVRTIASGTMCTQDLVGFIEYFHTIDNPQHICIDKLYINTAYEGMGFSRRLIQELHRLPRILTVEVWSLWHTERFYKEHGYVDVPHPKGGRVQADWGPLLIWMKSNAKVSNPRVSIVGDGSYRFE
ncbi:hypothetical protein DFJ77DRAFT_470189 [Powellomyces hirtus]|nr:hypothetical protein DFJ77DRAFT_470189 [Powellomyces hirtus]